MAGELAGAGDRAARADGVVNVARSAARWLVARRSWLVAAAAPLAASVIALWLIVPTVLPDVANWDTAEFQTVLPLMGTAHPTGFPAYVVLGWLASIVLMPFGSPAYRVDLLQAIIAAVAVGATVTIVRQLGAPRSIAFAIGVVVTTTLLFWRLSTHADPHMFHVALLAILLAVLIGWEDRRRSEDEARQRHADRWLVAAAFVYGVAVANHGLSFLLAPAIAVFVLMVEPRVLFRWRLVATCAAVLGGTIVLFYLELPIRAAMQAPLVYAHPDTWSGFWYVVRGQQFGTTFVAPFTQTAQNDWWQALGFFPKQLGWTIYLLPLGYVAVLLRNWQSAVINACIVVSLLLLLAPSQFAGAIERLDITPFCLALGLSAVLTVRFRYGVLSGLAFFVTCWFSMSYANADIERYYLGPLVIAYTWIGLALAETTTAAARIVVTPDWTGIFARVPERIAAAFDAAGDLAGSGALRTALTANVVADVTPHPEDDAATTRRAAVDRYQLRRRERQGRSVLATLVPLVAIVLIAPQLSVVADRDRPAAGAQGPGVNESARTGDRAWLTKVMSGLPADSIVLSSWAYSTTLWYGHFVEGMRPDVYIADDRTRLDYGPFSDDIMVGIKYYFGHGRPVFVIKPDKMSQIEQAYDVKPWFGGSVYEIVGPKQT